MGEELSLEEERAMREEREPKPPLDEEAILEKTGFKLGGQYPDFAKEGWITPSFHDDFDRWREQFGEGNVISSLFSDEAGELQLGIFIRESAFPED